MKKLRSCCTGYFQLRWPQFFKQIKIKLRSTLWKKKHQLSTFSSKVKRSSLVLCLPSGRLLSPSDSVSSDATLIQSPASQSSCLSIQSTLPRIPPAVVQDHVLLHVARWWLFDPVAKERHPTVEANAMETLCRNWQMLKFCCIIRFHLLIGINWPLVLIKCHVFWL